MVCCISSSLSENFLESLGGLGESMSETWPKWCAKSNAAAMGCDEDMSEPADVLEPLVLLKSVISASPSTAIRCGVNNC